MSTTIFKIVRLILILAFIHIAGIVVAQSPFMPGNIVVLRVGPTVNYNSYSKVFLDEYSATGSLIQSIPLPATSNGTNLPFTLRFGAADAPTGSLSLSPDGKYLAVIGSAAVEGVTCNPCGKSIAIVDYNGNVNTRSSLPSGGLAPGAAITSNGTDIWGGSLFADVSLMSYTTLGSSSSTPLANGKGNNAMSIVSGQLYVSYNGLSLATDPGFIGTVGSGLPTTSGQTITKLPGLATDIRPNQFFLADINPAIPGVDVLYFANCGRQLSGIPQGDGIHKYSLVGNTWVFNGSIGILGDNYRGLTGKVTGTTITLYSTRKLTSTARGGELVMLTDASGYNGNFTSVPVVLVTADPSISFRGVALTPQAPVCSSITGLVVSNLTGASAGFTWNTDGGSTSYEYAVTTSSATPSAGIVISTTSFAVNGLLPATTYYVHVRNKCGALNSPWISRSFKTACPSPQPFIISNLKPGNASIGWHPISGVTNYEYATLTKAVDPIGGTITNDTAIHLANLIPGVKHFFNVRSYCADLSRSDWARLEFHPGAIEVFPNPATNSVTIRVYGNFVNGSVYIYDAGGKLHKKIKLTGNLADVDLSGFASGLYWVRYENVEGYVTKLIKF